MDALPPMLTSPGPAARFTFRSSYAPAHMLSILMPVYNEQERVKRAIAEVLEVEVNDL